MFKKKKKPAPLPELPQREDKEVIAARKQAIVDARVRRGRSSTILTSPLGLVSEDKPRKSTLFGE
tara:strand:- start:547 stop:741 length:195 start_codon:yes stop_codon:yes gene_type:complete